MRMNQSRRQRASAAPASRPPSEVLVNHLCRIGDFDTSVGTVDHAIEKLLNAEAEAFCSLMGADNIYPAATLGFGAEFVARAIDVVVCHRPGPARRKLVSLLAELRSEMRDRITLALAERTAAIV